jgi:predicted PolB exonuclease-like 3'-5' exonuclease
MTPTLVFDIETVPDIAGVRTLHGLGPELGDAEVAQFAFSRRRAQNGTDFLPLHLHRVIAISCALRDRDSLRIWSLGTAEDSESQLVARFFDGIEKYTPQLVSWNGGGFDLPVLNYRALMHGVSAAKFWEWGEEDRSFNYNNYVSRYHKRHLDLMDVMAFYQPRINAPLDDMAKLCGFPGKLGFDGSEVWGAWQSGGIARIRDYCETDVANTYLVYLRFQQLRGVLDAAQYQSEIELVRSTLARGGEPHWREYLDAWKRA